MHSASYRPRFNGFEKDLICYALPRHDFGIWGNGCATTILYKLTGYKGQIEEFSYIYGDEDYIETRLD